MLGPTAHTDTFSREGLPPADQWPDFVLDDLEGLRVTSPG